jgi:hypothetical protein
MSNIFNPKQITLSDTNKITNIVSVVDKDGFSLLNNFMSKTGDSMSGTLQLSGNDTKLIFPDGSIQAQAFDEGYKTETDRMIEVTQDMSVINGVLRMNQDVEVTGNIDIPDNSFRHYHLNCQICQVLSLIMPLKW